MDNADYKRLADAILKRGFGYPNPDNMYAINPSDDVGMTAKEFVSDGRVVLAMIDKVMAQRMGILIEHDATGMAFVEIRRAGFSQEMIAVDRAHDITPIAIAEACVAALGEKVDE